MQTINIFPWNDNFNTGVAIIDEQHQRLVEILNHLASQLAQKLDEQALNTILEELSDYTIYHFETEEAYWSEHIHDEPTLKEHQEVHESFIKKIALLKEEQREKPLLNVVEDALEFLTNWLASHILETDRETAYTVEILQEKKSLQEAKKIARDRMNDSSHIFIQIILSIYATLSQNTLKLIKELKLNQDYDETLLYENDYRQLLLELSSSFINMSTDESEDREILYALERMALFLNLDRGYLFRYNPQNNTATNTHEWCREGVQSHKNALQNFSVDLFLECYVSHQEAQNVLIKDVSLLEESQFKTILTQQNIKSLINVPLMHKQECYGFVGFSATQALHNFTDVELTLLKLFAQLLENLHERKENEKSLLLAATVFAHTHEGVLITSPQNKIIQTNQAVTNITGYTQEELLGKDPKMLSSGKNSPEFYKKMWKSLSERDFWSGEIWNRHKSGEFYAEMLTVNTIRDKEGKILNHIALFADITSIKQHESHLKYLAHYDSLTGLPNRALLGDRIATAIAQLHQKKTSLAVIYLDLDGFKETNDKYGHDCGDILLSILAKKMSALLRSNDTIARVGGDEFVIVLTDLQHHEKSLPFLESLLESVSSTNEVNGKFVNISASVGVSFFDADDLLEPDQLIRQADQAMYRAKIAGKNRYHIFDPVEDATIRTHHKKVSSIREALKRDEFELFYQPKVNMKKGSVVGFEALIRWRHPEDGILPPALFLPFIEEDEMSIKIGEWVLEEACKQILLFKEQNLHLSISININAIHLLKGDFIGYLKETLKRYPTIEKGDLIVEILETSVLEDLEQVSNIIKKGQHLGVGFSLDDFGTGYSSLTYLKKLAVEQIKIDQSFIRDMLIDSDDLAIIEGVITLSAAFRREIIAEGVESVEHGEILMQLGCEFAQGYAIAKPMPRSEIEQWLKEYKPQEKWQNTKRLQREKITYLHAIVEHNAWLKNALLSFEHRQHHKIELDPQKCNFGLWLENHPDEDKESFKAIHKRHKELHDLAARIATKDKKNTIQDIKHLKEISKKLTGEIREVILS